MRTVLFPFSVLALTTSALAGKVWVVGPAPGQLPDLQNAIIQAHDGDVIIVKSGTYESIRMAGKSVSIIAEVGATVQLPGSIRVLDIPVSKSIVLSGLRAEATYQNGSPELYAGLVVRNCAGALTVQDGVFTIPSPFQPPSVGPNSIYGAVGVQNCAALSIVRSSMLAGALTSSPGLQVRGNGSFVSLSQVQCAGARAPDLTGPDGAYGDGFPGFDGLVVGVPGQPSSSFVFASKSVFTGGAGGGASYWLGFPVTCGQGGTGGSGIRGNNPTGFLRLLECTPVGGAGGPGWSGGGGAPPLCWMNVGCTGQGIYMTPASFSCQPIPSGPPTTFSVTVGQARLLSGPTLVRDTTPLSLTFNGVSGEVIELAVSDKKPTFVDMPTQFGVQHIDQPEWRRVGGLQASHSVTLTFPLPNLKITNPGATWFMQARFTNATTGQVRLSNLHTVVEVDASY